MRIDPRALMVIAAFSVMGCDPDRIIEGTVKKADGTPVPQATVRMNCKSWISLKIEAVTNSKGEFVHASAGCIPKECTVEIAPPAGSASTYRVADHCAFAHSGCGSDCSKVRIDAVVR